MAQNYTATYVYHLISHFCRLNTVVAHVMLRKLKHAVAERDEQIAAFQRFNDVLPKNMVAEWRELVEAWEHDPQKPNPFFVENDCKYPIRSSVP